ncbi:MAG TPA: FG-GAP-like repeat-containing protein, partial [Anaerolineae bacterium]|nr:FG-GAP-like repeat-containing protein [Anaerolineae bacterium]
MPVIISCCSLLALSFLLVPNQAIAHTLSFKYVSTAKQSITTPANIETSPTSFPDSTFFITAITNGGNALDWGDWDNDGDLDLALASNYTLKIYENDAGVLTIDELSGYGLEIDLDSSAADLQWGDWDGDGDLDLAIAGNSFLGDGYSYVYENDNGQNLYLDPANNWGWQTSDLKSSQAVAWGDYDNDGDLDLALATGRGGNAQYNELYENIGTTLSLTWQSPNTDIARDLAWGDYDNDGDLDLIISTIGGDNMNHLYENVNGTLLNELGFGWSGTSLSTYSVDWGDWNDDGYLDLAFGAYAETYIYTNNTVNSFDLSYQSTHSPNTSYAVSWGDWDNDGDLDLATAGNRFQRIIENDAYATFEFDTLNNWGWEETIVHTVNDIKWADWDNDGNLDLTIADTNRNVILGNHSGLPIDQAITFTHPLSNPQDLAWGDWDNDGDLDVVVATGNGYPLQLWENDNGTLKLDPSNNWGWESTETVTNTAVAWGDWDNDNDLDLAVGNGDNTPNYVYENDGGTLQLNQTSLHGWISPNSYDTSQIAWGDYDNDGDLDLAVANRNGPNIIYQNNNNNSTLSPLDEIAWQSTYISATTDISWGDYDNDGDLDLTIANFDSYNLIYENENGTLNLDPDNGIGWRSPYAFPTNALAWGDWDGDGDLDLAVGNDGALSYIFENIAGNLQVSIANNIGWASATNLNAHDIVWFDWDGDGDLDLQTAGGDLINAKSYFFENINQSDQFLYTISDLPVNDLAWGDLDQDGDLDWGAVGPSNSFIHLNNSRPNNNVQDLARIHVSQPANTPSAYGFATANFITTTIVPLTYTLNGNIAGHIQVEFSPNGGGEWFTAVPAAGSIINNPATGVPHPFYWDTFASGFFGQSDNMIVRFTVYPQPATVTSNGTYDYYLPRDTKWTYHSAQTTPFRIRGTQIQVYGTHLTPDAYWNMDTIIGTGAVANQIEGLPEATFVGSPTILSATAPTDFTNQYAISFTTVTSDGLAVANHPVINSASNYPYRTISLWFKANNPNGPTQILWEDGGAVKGFNMYIENNHLYIGGWGDFGWSGTWHNTTIEANRWYHAALVLDGPQRLFSAYLNGQLIGRETNATDIGNHPGGIGIGYMNGDTRLHTGNATGTGLYYTGLIDEVRLFNSSFTDDQIRQLYTAGVAATGAVKNAIVYRIPSGQSVGGKIMGNDLGEPFTTNGNGYLSGNGTIGVGDQLIALYPITTSAKYDVYYTSASPTTIGLNAHTVQAGGTQRLTVSPNNPLILYHLNISLEWDARQDGSYLQEL